MQEFQLGGLISESSLRTTPQDSLKNCETDFTSIFGTFEKNECLRGIPIMMQDENKNTPFSHEAMMHNIFADENADFEHFHDADDDEEVSTLEFEC